MYIYFTVISEGQQLKIDRSVGPIFGLLFSKYWILSLLLPFCNLQSRRPSYQSFSSHQKCVEYLLLELIILKIDKFYQQIRDRSLLFTAFGVSDDFRLKTVTFG